MHECEASVLAGGVLRLRISEPMEEPSLCSGLRRYRLVACGGKELKQTRGCEN